MFFTPSEFDIGSIIDLFFEVQLPIIQEDEAAQQHEKTLAKMETALEEVWSPLQVHEAS